ncbi:MAG: family transcriptional regulator [Armatimonadetes bacterium]|nr:family transcriptional regulator [Armatimonadota bacterium]
MNREPSPTDPRRPVDRELHRWSSIYAGEEYYYGREPGPVARRAIRYHAFAPGATALDAGCGEGQDLRYLLGLGYDATGVEFTPHGAEKARRLTAELGTGRVVEQDLRSFVEQPQEPYDLVIAVNSIQFLGADASDCLGRLMDLVKPRGVLGLSLFAREPDEPEVSGTVWFTTLNELLLRFRGWQPLEAANLWQWNVTTNHPQPFVTLIARKLPPANTGFVSLDR